MITCLSLRYLFTPPFTLDRAAPAIGLGDLPINRKHKPTIIMLSNVPTLPIEGAIADDSSTVEAATSGKLSPEEFVNKVLARHRAKNEAWKKAGKPLLPNGKVDTTKYEKYAGCHTVYSGFNDAFRRYYGEGIDPVETTKGLAKDGTIVSMPSRGGAMLHPAGTRGVSKGNDLLADLGLDAA